MMSAYYNTVAASKGFTPVANPRIVSQDHVLIVGWNVGGYLS